MSKPRILVFGGSGENSGSGFENLVKASRDGTLHAEIIGAVSTNASGGVCERAKKLSIPFLHFPEPWTAPGYQYLAEVSEADYFASSGWLKRITGLDPNTRFNSKTVFNIHPGDTVRFGGKGMYGRHIHEAVIGAFQRGEITHTAIVMHFVTEEYDRGPVFFRLNLEIMKDDTPKTLAKRVNEWEHRCQPEITNMVVNGKITWDGINPASLKVPAGYTIERGRRSL